MDEILKRFLDDRSDDNRNAVVNSVMPLVKKVAKEFDRRLFQDLVQAGAIGVIEALDQFEKSRGVKFSNWAAKIARFRMLDHLRTFNNSRQKRKYNITFVELPPDLATHDKFDFDTPEEAIAEMCKGLSEREIKVVTLSFADNMTLQQIGDKLGVTKARASQIRASAIRRLRARYQTAVAGHVAAVQ